MTELKTILPITEEQNQKLIQLTKDYTWQNIKSSIKNGAFLASAMGLIIFYNQVSVHSQLFVFFASATSGFFWYKLVRESIKKEYDRTYEEAKKILDN